MNIKEFLELLEDESWQALGMRVPYELRKEAKDAGWVESLGKTNGQQWHITNAGVAELRRLRAESGEIIDGATVIAQPVDAVTFTTLPRVYTEETAQRMADLDPISVQRVQIDDSDSFDPEAPGAFDGRQSLRESYMEGLSRTAIGDQVVHTEILATPEEKAKGLEEDLRTAEQEIERLNDALKQCNATITEYDKQTQRISAMMSDDFKLNIMSMAEYVTWLRQVKTEMKARLEEISALDEAVGELAEFDNKELLPLEYVNWLRESLRGYQGIEAEMEIITGWAIDDGAGELSPLDYVDDMRLNVRILTKICEALPKVAQFVEVARAEYAAFIALKGE